MDEYATLNHTTWDCKYHVVFVVFIPKYRRKLLFQELRKPLGEVFRQLAAQKELKVEEGHLLPDHVHMLLSIPPKYAVSNVVGYIKGKSAIHLARTYSERKRNFVGQSFWARGYFVIPGFNEDSGKMSCVWRWVGFGWPDDSRRLSYRRGSQSADRAGSRRFGRRSRDKARQRAGAVG